ncbi:MAG: hypothetical protein QNJ46_31295 [Leptolyngbyaceae cyanobacterium MO_188.B28]|nr:hypothetical protein [Leptolyngbyaceae cyanobacterium MO_188.B28]
MKLGEILVRKRLLSQSQLDCFIIIQSSTHQKLGELLVDHGVIDSPALEQALDEQNWRSRGLWVID